MIYVFVACCLPISKTIHADILQSIDSIEQLPETETEHKMEVICLQCFDRVKDGMRVAEDREKLGRESLLISSTDL